MDTRDQFKADLKLKRNIYFNEWLKDHSDGSLIAPGEYYYEWTNEEGKTRRISCKNYWKLKKQDMEDNNPYQNMLDEAENQTDYKKQLEETEQEYIQSTILNNHIFYRHK